MAAQCTTPFTDKTTDSHSDSVVVMEACEFNHNTFGGLLRRCGTRDSSTTDRIRPPTPQTCSMRGKSYGATGHFQAKPLVTLGRLDHFE